MFFSKRKTSKTQQDKSIAEKPDPCVVGDIDFCLEELLGRKPKGVDSENIRHLIEGESVMVTGAGGTIGSELCRQIIKLNPACLILADNGEHNLYQIDRELRGQGHGDRLTPQLVSVCQRDHVMQVFKERRPSLVIHAAAIKHVPIVEVNPCAAALTNAAGTKNVLDAAIEFRCNKVVLISTDKAVNPTSFYGATKRLAELYAQALDVAQTDTRFVTVRFGNVLGSTGSVVPLFKEQIKAGGPVTVTHPDVQRFFMTVSEAATLVLTAASLEEENGVLSHDGRIFVLDMGEPVRITALAERMIEAAGLKPHEDIPIVYTGLRPGEKLFEEIFHSLEKLLKTGTDGVLLASPTMIDLPLLLPRFSDVIRYAKSGETEALREAVHHLVPEFRPSAEQAPTPQEEVPPVRQQRAS
ncbi:UDP-N-acetylglucosamine 4,6-dehydratase family protein [Parvularcula maris]|uniref:Polysaccharide biosynthesis protein n=1 Tax=Parvularcula maris TaxID=2965077 RepID=A0A9X2L8Y5_9PROT|nr:polysaccharide biosynthesis protein [Parvularcula maris]MCQ8185202.1 polysaccharide biosynthesis protein [Parvularcula maris]